MVATEELSNQRKTGIKGRRTGGNQRQDDKKSDGKTTIIVVLPSDFLSKYLLLFAGNSLLKN